MTLSRIPPGAVSMLDLFLFAVVICHTAIICDAKCLVGSGRIPCTRFITHTKFPVLLSSLKKACERIGTRPLAMTSLEEKYALNYIFSTNNFKTDTTRIVGVERMFPHNDKYQIMGGPDFGTTSPLWLRNYPQQNNNYCVGIALSSGQNTVGYKDVDCSKLMTGLCEGCQVFDHVFNNCTHVVKCNKANPVCREADQYCLRVYFSNLTDYLPCPYNRYGCECQFQCHCAENVPCDLYTGTCPAGCKENWEGRQCDRTRCPLNKYGASCEKGCFCKHSMQCDVITGHCLSGCPHGMSGPGCNRSDSCDRGKYGPECAATCACAAGAFCDQGTGRCLSDTCLEKSKSPPYCNDVFCPEVGKYGPDCDQKCMCKMGEPCHSMTGVCASEVCPAIGKGGLDCYDECPKELTCKRCLRLNMTKCGECVEGFRLTPNNTCEKGQQGPTKPWGSVAGFVAVSASNMWVIILIVVLLIVILVALVDIYIFLQKKDEHSEASQDGEKGLEEQSEQSSEKHEGASDKDEEESMQGSEDEEGDENPQTGEKKESSASSKKHSSASSKKHSSASSKKHSSASSKKQSNASKKQSNVSKMSTVSENLE
ncbi:cell death abnormality protein 1 isoform X2 [Aplysia californica]|uniref:Cell death abnormality protein 1 isoform X2 n=1 Tax=Aplysia californica TaxID=6500 RepID=A0ABM0K0G8_APLCA|nr:cell death abnormality protein 1 isoform X2 [Aplysia californica]